MLLALETLLELKFQAEGLGVLPEIRAITDVDLLTAVCQALKTASTIDELRRIWTK
jgi:hypothetical protein